MGKAFVIKGIDASDIAIKKINIPSNMTDITKNLITQIGYQIFKNVSFNNAIMKVNTADAIVLDVSAYHGKSIAMYIPSLPTGEGMYWRAFIKNFSSPITSSDWSSVVGNTQNAFEPSDELPYIDGEYPVSHDTEMIWKDVIVPNDANYLVVTCKIGFVSQVEVYVDA